MRGSVEEGMRTLFKKIEIVYNCKHGVYGGPRVYREEDDYSVDCREKRVARRMCLRGVS
jgi:hypothetical protein